MSTSYMDEHYDQIQIINFKKNHWNFSISKHELFIREKFC